MNFVVSTQNQTLTVLDGDRELWSAPVSTSKHGLGEESGSYRTPRGRLQVCEKIGDGAAPGTVFKGRQPTGAIWTPGQVTDEDLILTRILWLEGLDPGNQNTRERTIYFHGTNHEELIGQPASLGCIRLRNNDILRLYDLAEIGTQVLIQ
ncbi:MAG: L,D-transpeptidase [Methylacidiphilales bacterium]|nr:L,D-transpeptidase [Candidatus Methylacidiphilales bacterium]